LRVRHGGSGPPVLLLHGHPRTHVTWPMVAAEVAGPFTVVCPDSRGYGESSKPETTPDHAPYSKYSKRAMAADGVALIRPWAMTGSASPVTTVALTWPTAWPLTTPPPRAGYASRLCIMEGIPIGETLARCDARFAAAWYHRFFFGQTEHPAERFISADPRFSNDPAPIPAHATGPRVARRLIYALRLIRLLAPGGTVRCGRNSRPRCAGGAVTVAVASRSGYSPGSESHSREDREPPGPGRVCCPKFPDLKA
jgi:pimeloyl-ACP methyl ester carboxylesterase